MAPVGHCGGKRRVADGVDLPSVAFTIQTVATHASAPQYAGHMSLAIARALSIFGHPMLVLPFAAISLAVLRGQRSLALWMVPGFAVFAALVMGYSRWQVRRGRWAHVDASHSHERGTLNRFLLVVLLVSALFALWLVPARELSVGLALSAAMVATAMATARWCKLSLHMAFAVFAAVLLGVVWWPAGLAALAFAGAVAWSRLRLRRHVPRDLVAGAIAGALAGVALPLLAHGVS